jgi:hypothetical protein
MVFMRSLNHISDTKKRLGYVNSNLRIILHMSGFSNLCNCKMKDNQGSFKFMTSLKTFYACVKCVHALVSCHSEIDRS